MPEPDDPPLDADGPATLERQRSDIEAWLATDDARRTADRLLRRWGLEVAADDLIAEASGSERPSSVETHPVRPARRWTAVSPAVHGQRPGRRPDWRSPIGPAWPPTRRLRC